MKAIAYMNIHLRTPGEVGAAIRTRRRALGWDQAELAEKVGVSRLWVNQIERGKPGAGLGLVLRTVKTLGLTLSIEMVDELNVEIETAVPVKAAELDAIVENARKRPAP